jgi:hypothetical protein
MAERSKARWWWWAAIAAGLLLRVAFVAHHARWTGDALSYADLAHNLVAHHVFGFTNDDGSVRATIIRLPGYPLFLALCFALLGSGNFLAVLWVQVGIDLFGCWLLARLAQRLFDQRAGLFVLWAAALCPFTANYVAAPLTETLSIFCVTVAMFALERWRMRRSWPWAVVIGCTLAYAVLLRPDGGLLSAAVVPVMLWLGWRAHRLRGVRGAVVAAGIVSATLLVWGLRNWRAFHVFQPLAPRYANEPGEFVPYGFQRWYRSWAIDLKATLDVYWKYDSEPIRLSDLPPRATDLPGEFARTAAVIAAYNPGTTATPELDRRFAALAAERAKAHPWRTFVALPIARDLDMWLRPRTEMMALPVAWWQWRAHPLGSAVAFAYGLWNAAYLLLALLGWWRWRCARWGGVGSLAFAMTLFVALRFALLLTLDNSEPRYTLECYPMVLLLAGVAMATSRRRAA